MYDFDGVYINIHRIDCYCIKVSEIQLVQLILVKCNEYK